MKDNTSNIDGVPVYEHRIYELVDKYISELDNPEEINSKNKAKFNGLLKYIYLHYFRYHKPNYDDINGLNDIWNIYTSICYRYTKRPTIIGFCVMTDIDKSTINSWLNCNTKNYIYYDENNNIISSDVYNLYKANKKEHLTRKELSTSHSDTVKKWMKECEQALLDGATEENSIGCIFALKASYGYAETAPVQAESSSQLLTAAELPKLGTQEVYTIPDVNGPKKAIEAETQFTTIQKASVYATCEDLKP